MHDKLGRAKPTKICGWSIPVLTQSSNPGHSHLHKELAAYPARRTLCRRASTSVSCGSAPPKWSSLLFRQEHHPISQGLFQPRQTRLARNPSSEKYKLPNSHCNLWAAKQETGILSSRESLHKSKSDYATFWMLDFLQDGEAQRYKTCFALVIEINYHNPPRVLQSLFFRLNLSWEFWKSIFSFPLG